MKTLAEVVLDRDNANDEEAVVVAVRVRSGAPVKRGEVILEIENSKATQEVEAPQNGTLLHALNIGDTLAYGTPIARIVDGAPTAGEIAALAAAPPAAAPSAAAPSSEPRLRRLSQSAAALAQEHDVDVAKIDSDFITSDDIRRLIGLPVADERPAPAPSPGKPSQSVPSGAVRILPHKREEIRALSSGAGAGMLSVLGTDIGTIVSRPRGLEFFQQKILDLVVYEASRLMRSYPKLNAAYRDAHIAEHAHINAGIALDQGGRLLVYGVEDSDKKDLAAIQLEVLDAVERYVGNALTTAEVSRATFTITDLSDSDLDFVFPLLPAGQSSILGITRAKDGRYGLFIGFDHRVTEGLVAANFLGELKDRLRSFHDSSLEDFVCEFCQRDARTLTNSLKAKGLLKVVRGDGREVLCCHACWSGW